MNMKLIASFVCGAVSGGVGTYIYLTKYKKIEYEVIEPKESIYVEEENDQGDTEWRQYGKTDKVLETVEEVPDADLMDFYKQKESEETTTMVDYQGFAKAAKEKAAEGRPDPAQVPKKRETTMVISDEEFEMERTKEELGQRFMESAVIALYSDGTCVDESDGSEHEYSDSEADDFLGYENIQKFMDSDKQEIIIRNVEYGIDYQVYKKDCTWAEMSGVDSDEEYDEQ